MPLIHIQNTRKDIQASPAISILNNLLRNGTAISHICGGKAQCGTCRIKIIDGERSLSPKTEMEKKRLEKVGNPHHMRLACQTYTSGDITIKILFEKPPGTSIPPAR